jgi:hypothetical protein
MDKIQQVIEQAIRDAIAEQEKLEVARGQEPPEKSTLSRRERGGFSTNHYKARSITLQRLGFQNYGEYLRSEWWAKRRDAYAAYFPSVCRFCRETAVDLHHKSYKRLGCERDADLCWVCRRHHAEAHERGFVGKPTDIMKIELRRYGIAEPEIARLTFGDAFSLIGQLRSRTTTKSTSEADARSILGNASSQPDWI